MKLIAIFIFLTVSVFALEVKQKRIIFDEKRIQLTQQYIKKHYGLDVKDISITPKIIVIHHTGINSFEKSFNRFFNSTLPNDRPDIINAGNLNVSTHFMIDADGTIYQLMSETFMARHVIGLNFNSIGIENVGGENFEDNLTPAQLRSNIKLIDYLQNKYPTISHLIGHYEYRNYEKHTLWLEKNKNYRTIKHDPSPRFMKDIRNQFTDLKP